MRTLLGVVCLLVLSLTSSQAGPNGYYQTQSRYSSSSSSSYGGGGSSSSSSSTQLNSWAYRHLNEVREFANRLRLEYNAIAQGTNTYDNAGDWSATILELTGKSGIELDSLSRQICQQIVNDMRQGSLHYSTFSQSNFFESKSAQFLESFASSAAMNLQQQHALDLTVGHAQPVDLSSFDEVKNYAYPAEVKVIDGRTYVVHKNCTEAMKVTQPKAYYVQSPSSTTVITRKKTIYDWVNEHMEPSVINYRPVVRVDGTSSAYNQISSPATTSTVTIHRVNKTYTSGGDGINSVRGSQSQQRWVNGQLVYDQTQPFGAASTLSQDDQWKREERERFFWYLTSAQPLESWQRQQEERLLAVAQRYHTTVEIIEEFHRRELERYRALLSQYQSQLNDATAWQRKERGRLDWLIHQNSFTVDEFERWQHENSNKLVQLARQYRVQPEELQQWQRQELQRLYVYFNKVNNSIATPTVPIGAPSSLVSDAEQERLNELIRQHNSTIDTLQQSIRTDQQRFKDLSVKFQGNVQETENWLKSALSRISGLIKDQNDQISRITEWQRSERTRLETILKQHQGSVGDLERQMSHDRTYIQNLAAKYHVSIEELEKWQSTELERLQHEGQSVIEANIKEWQLRERQHLKNIVSKNDLSIEEFQANIMNDRARIEQLSRTYKVQVTEIEEWLKSEIKKLQSEGLLKEVEKELALWQQRERERLQRIVEQNSLTVDELEQKIKTDQSHFYELANTYQIRVEDIQEWLKKELVRLQSEGLIKAEALKDWQQAERQEIMKIVQHNRYTIDDFEKKLLADRERLQDLSKTYNVQVSEIEKWILAEGDRLQREGQLKMQEQLNNWQKIERQRLLDLINKNNLSIEELEARITKDQVHLYSLAQQHQVRVEEIEEWIKEQIKQLQAEGVIEMQKLKNWQLEWRGNLTNMVQERDFTVEEFHKWLLEDRSRLQSLAMQHNVQIEEIEQFVKREEQRFVSMGLLKPSEKLTSWQEVERIYLERLAQQQYKSTEQLEARLRQDREVLEKLARQYSVQVEEIEKWMKQELARLRDKGQLQIDNLTTWQLAERERLEALIKQNKQWSAEDFEAALRADREHMQTMAFQYHTSVEEIERWVQSEIDRLKQQGKLNIEKMTEWQKAEQQRILSLLQQQSSITVEEFEEKVQRDRQFLVNLAKQYHVSVVEIEEYIQKVVEDLRQKGKFEIEKLQAWQVVERQYIQQLIAQYNNALTTDEYEKKLLADRVHLYQLADQYRVNVEQIENWMIAELKRLRGDTETEIQKLTTWQVGEVERLKKLLQDQNHLSYVEFEVELQQERKRLEQLAQQYSVSVVEIEEWLRQQLVNLKTTGQVKVENLTKWQAGEQQRLIELLLKQQQDLSYAEFEQQLQNDRSHLQGLSQTYHVSIEQIEQFMRDELSRLKNSGLVQVEQQTIWQREMSNGFNDWLKEQHNGATYQEFVDFLKRDKMRISNIAEEYHITVEDVEKWVQKEAARLSLIGVIERPQNHVSYEEITKIWQENNVPNTVVHHTTTSNEEWKQQTAGRLRAIAYVRPMTWEQYEEYIVENRPKFEQLARQYNITVEDIIVWLHESATKLAEEGLITGSLTLEEWQSNEEQYIQSLINDQLRRQHKWTIEELELKLINDHQRVEEITHQYGIQIEELESWYRQELKRLLDQRKILPGNVVEWKTEEKERIYLIAVQHPGSSRVTLEELLLHDRSELQRQALKYHITVEDLTVFIREELHRLADLGFIIDGSSSLLVNNNWQEEERKRLGEIAATIKITEEEVLQFISADNTYQQQLAAQYGVGLEKLAPYQRIVIGNLEREQHFQRINLNHLQPWQQRERDRLYSLIRNQKFTLKNLRDWQRQDILLNEFAGQYGISEHELKEWQLREFQRIMQVAEHYHMTLHQLQDFRDRELRYLTYVMHKKSSSQAEIQNWERNEAARAVALERQSGFRGEELLEWRRTLYLLAQGLIDLPLTGTDGGQVIDPGSTNATFVPKPVYSKDRGDQPPNGYEELLDEDEPGLEGEIRPPKPLPMPIISTPSPLPPYQPKPYPTRQSAGGGSNSGYLYRKQEYQFTVPVGSAAASASAYQDGASASASAKFGPSSMTRSVDHHLPKQEVESLGQQQEEDLGQQQQEDLSWDAGQQQQEQEDVNYNANYRSHQHHQQQQLQHDDLGQQQVQVEDLSGQGFGNYRTQQRQEQQQQVEHADYGQQQVQVEDLSGQGFGTSNIPSNTRQSEKQIKEDPTKEVKAEPEPKSTWESIKAKTSSWFG